MIVLAHTLNPRVPVEADGETVVERGSLGIWFLFKQERFDIARVYSASEVFKGYYVDSLEPVRWQRDRPETLETLVDLYLDLWIWPNGRCTVLDETELERAEANGHVTAGQAAESRATISRLRAQVERRLFPPPVVASFPVDRDLISAVRSLPDAEPSGRAET
ncbi:MAG TPA: DUF402 domain-containing protein [Chloroflexota bacterium]|nr:DUF402 domain-containing protein [Chloroflexota bacterium]